MLIQISHMQSLEGAKSTAAQLSKKADRFIGAYARLKTSWQHFAMLYIIYKQSIRKEFINGVYK